jgi:hypothetical protein
MRLDALDNWQTGVLVGGCHEACRSGVARCARHAPPLGSGGPLGAPLDFLIIVLLSCQARDTCSFQIMKQDNIHGLLIQTLNL